MLRLSPALAGATARFAILLASAALLTGCDADAENPLGPDARFGSGTPVSVAETGLAAQQATNLQFGDFALHVPANVHQVRGILVALGGPDTRGFAAGTPFGAPVPAVEASLQQLGVMFRDLAAERGLAILGSGRFAAAAYPNEPASDQLLLDGIAQAASLSGHPELTSAPILLFAASGGAPEASGFTQRHPERVTGLFLKVPESAGPLTGPALDVPAYMVLAELDAFVDNTALTATFETHRAAGAPWARALEPGVPHHAFTPALRELTVDWMRAILSRQGAGPFRGRSPQVGWLGDPGTGQVASVRSFAGDPGTASWFPTRPLAEEWAAFIGF